MDALGRLAGSLRTRGLANTLRLAARWGSWRLAPSLHRRAELWVANRGERRFDRRFGTDTRSARGVVAADAPTASRRAATPYEATTRGAFRLVVRASGPCAGRTFVDIGCGKAKLLMLAAEHGFRRAIGVEHSPALAAAAEVNLRAYRRVRPNAPPIDVVLADAIEMQYPDEDLLVYLYNPFGAEWLARLEAALRASFERRPRDIAIAYLNPLHAAVFDASPFLRRTGVAETILQGSCYLYGSRP